MKLSRHPRRASAVDDSNLPLPYTVLFPSSGILLTRPHFPQLSRSRLRRRRAVYFSRLFTGDSTLGEVFLTRVTDKPYRMAARLVWRRSAESDELFRMMAKPMWRWLTIALPLFIPEYTKLKCGEDVSYEFEATQRPQVEPGFDGSTVLLIGEGTYSSAMMFADGVRTYDLMLTIGQPTGGVPNALGDVGPFQLPNSRIVVNFSQKMFIRASGDESDLGPVRPHIEVAPVADRDAALERAVEEIRKMQAERKQ